MTGKGLIEKAMELLSAPGHPYVPLALQFPLIDIDVVARQLDLVDKGKTRGAKGNPATDAAVFDDVEQRIVSVIGDAKTTAQAIYHDNLHSYEQRLAALDFKLFVTEIKGASLEVCGNYLTSVNEGKGDLYLARKAVLELDREFSDFKLQHRLKRSPAPPTSRWLLIGVFLFVFIVEVILNGAFLGEAHSFGMIGGVSEAVAVAIMNVGTGFLVGWLLLPYAGYRYLLRRTAAIVIFTAYIGFIFSLNLGFAHYRDLLALPLSDTATAAAWERLVSDPFGVDDVKSWFLFALGVLFWLIALIEGRRMDDPYPGYGDIDRCHRKVINHYNDVKRDCYDGITSRRDHAATNLEHAKQKLTGRQAELITVAQARRRLSNSFAEYLNHLELAGRDLLARYREANRSARREADQPAPPPYFGVEWALERPPQERYMDIATDEVKDLVEAAIIALQGAITDIHDAYRNAVSEFDSIETITSEKETAGGPAGA